MRWAGWAALGLVVSAGRVAAADGARGVAAAGAVTASVDDETTLRTNPAGLARTSTLRLTTGLGVTRATGDRERGGARFVGGLGAALPLGEHVVVGLSFTVPRSWQRATTRPLGAYDPAHDDRADAPTRYAGTGLRFAERSVLVGAAIRARSWLAVGGAVGASRVSLGSERVLWAGDPTGLTSPGELTPALDLGVDTDAVDGFVPTATLGVLAAPDAVPLELGLAARWRAESALRGQATIGASRDRTVSPDTPLVDASADWPGELAVALGARWVGSRAALELGGEIAWTTGTRTPTWTMPGALVEGTPLAPLPIGPSFLGTAAALRLAGELDVVRGLLAVIGGAAWERSALARSTVGPLAPIKDAWSFGAGVSVRTERARVMLAVRHTVGGDEALGATLRVQGVQGATSIPAATGEIRGGITTFVMGLTLDIP
jgi:hypothetical protein